MCRVWGLGIPGHPSHFNLRLVWVQGTTESSSAGPEYWDPSIGTIIAGTPCSNGRMGLSEFQCKAWRLCRNRLVPSETEGLGLGVFRFLHLGLQVWSIQLSVLFGDGSLKPQSFGI